MRPTIKGAAALAAISAAAMAVTPLASAVTLTSPKVENQNSNATVVPGTVSSVHGGNIYGADRIGTSLQALTAFQSANGMVDGIDKYDSFDGALSKFAKDATDVAKAGDFKNAANKVTVITSGTYKVLPTEDGTDATVINIGTSVDLYIVSTKSIVDALSLAPISRGNASGGFVVYANQNGLDDRGFKAVSKLIGLGAVRRVFIVGGEKVLSSHLEEQVYDAAMAAKEHFVSTWEARYDAAAAKAFTGKTDDDLKFYADTKKAVYNTIEETASSVFDFIHFARLAGSDRFATAYQAGAWAANYDALSKAYEGTYILKRDVIAIQYASDKVAKATAAYTSAVRAQAVAETDLVNASTVFSINKNLVLQGLNPTAALMTALENLPSTKTVSNTEDAKEAGTLVNGYLTAVDDLKEKAAALYAAKLALAPADGNEADYEKTTTSSTPTIKYSFAAKVDDYTPPTASAAEGTPATGDSVVGAIAGLSAETVPDLAKDGANADAVKKAKAYNDALEAAKESAKAVDKLYAEIVLSKDKANKALKGYNAVVNSFITAYDADATTHTKLAETMTANFADQSFATLYKTSTVEKNSKVDGYSGAQYYINAELAKKDNMVTTSKQIINYDEVNMLAQFLLAHSATYANDARALLNANNAAIAAAKAVAKAKIKLDMANDELASAHARFDSDSKVPFYSGSAVKYGQAITDAYKNDVKAVFFTTGENFADALTAGPAAASMEGGVVILTPGKTFNTWSKSAAFLSSANASYYAVGGPAAEAAKANGLDLAASYVGKDRYETSVKLNNGVFGSNKKLYIVASGETGADSVVAGAYQASIYNNGDSLANEVGGIILTAKSELPASADNFFKSLRWGFQSAAFFGGNGVITNDVRAQVLTDMGASQAVLNSYISDNTFGYGN